MMDMSYITLIRLRDTLGLSAVAAAQHLGETNLEQWIKWESNQERAPQTLIDKAEGLLERFEKSLASAVQNRMDIHSYNSLEEYQSKHPHSSFIEWKLHEKVNEFLMILED